MCSVAVVIGLGNRYGRLVPPMCMVSCVCLCASDSWCIGCGESRGVRGATQRVQGGGHVAQTSVHLVLR